MISRGIATLFGIGYLPFAPGTWASIVAGISWYFFLSGGNFNPLLQIVIVFVTIAFGVWASGKVIPELGKDPSCVVIDEVGGMWIACLFLPGKIIWIASALVLFRLFDILKPFGIRKLENIKGGWGIMIDDIAAGILANVIVQLILVFGR